METCLHLGTPHVSAGELTMQHGGPPEVTAAVRPGDAGPSPPRQTPARPDVCCRASEVGKQA